MTEAFMAESTWLRTAHVGQDRRSDSRVPCVGATLIDVLSPNPRSSVKAFVVDVAPSGLKLNLPFVLSPGALIRIHMSDSVAIAEVRFCTCEGTEHFVGVTVEEVIPKGS
jgi:hypothetical protein